MIAPRLPAVDALRRILPQLATQRFDGELEIELRIAVTATHFYRSVSAFTRSARARVDACTHTTAWLADTSAGKHRVEKCSLCQAQLSAVEKRRVWHADFATRLGRLRLDVQTEVPIAHARDWTYQRVKTRVSFRLADAPSWRVDFTRVDAPSGAAQSGQARTFEIELELDDSARKTCLDEATVRKIAAELQIALVALELN